ncbi:hypothetical protein G2W53_026519 [Senna tora]|uniref:Uncharacterized protein n=1 Tax=Senna tora TaxID=362788 RepID=A0A834THB1_9FABA|nr:hypothetical protein G2W53_026519 [Senna tora]
MRKQKSQTSTSTEHIDDIVEETTSSSDSSSETKKMVEEGEDMAAEKTIREHNAPPVDQQPLCIAAPTLTPPFELKSVISLASSMQSLEQQMSQLATSVSKLESQGKLPSQTETNPKHNVCAITLRSGKELKNAPAKLRRGHALETDAGTEPEAELEVNKHADHEQKEEKQFPPDKTQGFYDQEIFRQQFVLGQKVFLDDSELSLFPSKLQSKWTNPFVITNVYSHDVVEIKSLHTGQIFKVNGHRLKPFYEGFKNATVEEVDLVESHLKLGSSQSLT